jgi:hypothetical protein
MRARNIKTGFHRIGLVLAFIFGVLGGLCLIVAVLGYASWSLDWIPSGSGDFWLALLSAGVAMLVLAAACYAGARALGWIIAGFVGDDY